VISFAIFYDLIGDSVTRQPADNSQVSLLSSGVFQSFLPFRHASTDVKNFLGRQRYVSAAEKQAQPTKNPAFWRDLKHFL
jgi:hypothetical protein